MQKVLVTGANGFIGTHLVTLLLQKGYDVHCLVRYTSNISGLRNLPVSIHTGDVRDPVSLKAPVENAVYIFHLAANLLVTSQQEFEETNVDGTRHVLEAAERYAKATLQRVLLVSSVAAAGPNTSLAAYDETVALNPISWYGLSKKKLEETAATYFNKLPITIVRPAIVYGERERDMSQIFPVVENHIHAKPGFKKKYSTAIYVGDLVAGMAAAAESPNSVGKAYFLNHPEVVTTHQIVKNIGIAMGKPGGLPIPIPDFLIQGLAPLGELMYYFNSQRPKMTRDKAREVIQRYWIADPSRAARDFGWSARYNMVEGMKKTLVPYFEEKRVLSAMALEGKFILWLKYFLIGFGLGVVVELFSYVGGFYSFHPWWLIFVIIVGAFAALFGTLAKALRKKSAVIQFLAGTLVAGLIELSNQLRLFGDYYWVFKEGWPLGITNPWLRVAVLGLPGGICIILLNIVMRNIYKRRLALRGDR
ncbi:MAG: NAD-dependent epimerase/dehydratase family protein [Williamsia sp.]|nr:NAD-dependent epimerase/dehydratase family protein [Williamsia sp.]